MTLIEAKRILPAPVKWGRYVQDASGRLGKLVPFYNVAGRGYVSEREYLRLALVVAVNSKRGR